MQVCAYITSVHIALTVDSVYEDHLRDYDTTGTLTVSVGSILTVPAYVCMYSMYDILYPIIRWSLYRGGLCSRVVFIQRWSL